MKDFADTTVRVRYAETDQTRSYLTNVGLQFNLI
jgi:hypothetical protein